MFVRETIIKRTCTICGDDWTVKVAKNSDDIKSKVKKNNFICEICQKDQCIYCGSVLRTKKDKEEKACWFCYDRYIENDYAYLPDQRITKKNAIH